MEYNEVGIIEDDIEEEEIATIGEDTGITKEEDPTVPTHVKNITEEDIERWNKEPEPYKLPIASQETLGGIKIGKTFNIAEDGTLNVNNEIPLFVGTKEKPINLRDKEIIKYPIVYIRGVVHDGPTIGLFDEDTGMITEVPVALYNCYDYGTTINTNLVRIIQFIFTDYGTESSTHSTIYCFSRTLEIINKNISVHVDWKGEILNRPPTSTYKTPVADRDFSAMGAYNLYNELSNLINTNTENIEKSYNRLSKNINEENTYQTIVNILAKDDSYSLIMNVDNIDIDNDIADVDVLGAKKGKEMNQRLKDLEDKEYITMDDVNQAISEAITGALESDY